MDTPYAIDLTKENIQLFNQGKKNFNLGTALQAQTNCEFKHQLIKEREYYELLIRSYEGEDQLKPRYDFVLWIEQNYPNLGPEIRYYALLEDTISIFKDDLNYKQDPRFIEILIRYVELHQNPTELYQTLFGLGLGTLCAKLYISWADALYKINDFKHANQVYEIGIGYLAQPMDQLKNTQKQFQLNVGRRILNCQTESLGKSKSDHQGLNRLQKSYPGPENAVNRPGIINSTPLTNCTKHKSAIQIYQDESDENTTCGKVKIQSDKFTSTLDVNKENTLPVGPWKNKNSILKKHVPCFTKPVISTTTQKFLVHEDNDVEDNVPTATALTSNILNPINTYKTVCPLAIFEPPDPAKKPMYPKHKVYAEGKEFQLEELRAAMYYKKYEENNAIVGEEDFLKCDDDGITSSSSKSTQDDLRDNGPRDFNIIESNNTVESKFNKFQVNNLTQNKDISNKKLDQKEDGNLSSVLDDLKDNGPRDFNITESYNTAESKFGTFQINNDLSQNKDISNKESDQKENGNLSNVVSFKIVSNSPVKTVFNAPSKLKDIIEDIWSDNSPVPATEDKKQTQPAAENDFDNSLIMLRNKDCYLDSFNLPNPSNNCNGKVITSSEKSCDKKVIKNSESRISLISVGNNKLITKGLVSSEKKVVPLEKNSDSLKNNFKVCIDEIWNDSDSEDIKVNFM